MNLVTSLGVLAAMAFLAPALIIFSCRLFNNKSLFILGIYFLSVGLCNLMSANLIPASDEFRRTAGLVNNYLDAPLVLLFLPFFCTNSRQKNMLYLSLAAFIIYEIVVTVVCGFNLTALVYILGPGVLILFGYSLYFFVKYARIAIEKNKQIGKAYMLGSIAFAYGCYGMIYCFHYLQKTSAKADVFLIYYIASIIASLIMSIGLVWMTRQAQKIKEVQLTRRELALFFNR